MKRLGNLWPRVVAFDNLLLAYRKARCGKTRRLEVARFSLNLETELLDLRRTLKNGTYRPGAYRQFTIYERKPRLIAAAPFRDRVVHHAVMNIIEPPLDRRFIYDSYACRKHKGVHAAVARYQGWARRYSYALKVDVARYFPSIDHDVLKTMLRRRIRDKQIIQLLDILIDTSPNNPAPVEYFPGDDLFTPLTRRTGIPIGNLTSQFFANLYLDDFDHYMKQRLGLRAYLRYVDDGIVLGDDKARLAEVREQIREQWAAVRLRAHPTKAHITRVRQGLDVLGYRVFPDFRLLRNDNGFRFRRRASSFAAAYERGEMSFADFDPSIQSWIGHAGQADTRGLRRALLGGIVFRRGAGHGAAAG